MIDLVKNLMQTKITISQVYMNFNIHMIRNTFYRCRVVDFSIEKLEELKKKICELLIIKKLGLGKKFSRKLLYININ